MPGNREEFLKQFGFENIKSLESFCTHLNWWEGCKYQSVGCLNCCAGAIGKKFIFNGFDLPIAPLALNKINFVTSSSDFFYEEADSYREEAWRVMERNPQALFTIVTKKPDRINVGYSLKKWPKNVFFNITIDEQKVALKRLQEVENSLVPFFGIFFEPLTEEINIDLSKYKKLRSVRTGGEHFSFDPNSPNKKRPCYYKWCKIIRDECYKNNIPFEMGQTGSSWYDENEVLHEISDLFEQENIGKNLGWNTAPGFDKVQLYYERKI